MSKKKIPIPQDVVDPKAYLIFSALENHPILKNTHIVTSEGDEVNIAMLPHRLRKVIEHLAPKEQENILAQKTKWNQMRAKASINKAKAYGRAGRYGGKTKDKALIKKLSPFEEDIVELLGRMFTVPEVIKIMGEDNGVIAEEEEVRDILRKNIVEIERKREEFRNKVADVRLYNKRPRLEELAWMYSKMKNRYIAVNTVDTYNAMLRTLEQIRKEAEGDIINFSGSMDVNVEVTIQNHIQKEILKTINLKEIILGRVAARMNFDTKKLIASMHNSYYAKFVDIAGTYEEDAPLAYPSSQAYDFAKIEAEATDGVADIKAEEVTEAQKTTATNIKELFLAKIRKQKEDLERRQAGWDAEAEARDSSKDVGEEQPIDRGRGRAKDKVPPSASKSKYKKNDRDYRTGKKK